MGLSEGRHATVIAGLHDGTRPVAVPAPGPGAGSGRRRGDRALASPRPCPLAAPVPARTVAQALAARRTCARVPDTDGSIASGSPGRTLGEGPGAR